MVCRGAIVTPLRIAFKLIFCYVYCVLKLQIYPFYCMSKKKHLQSKQSEPSHGLADTAEYQVIGRDLARVIVLNILYLAGLIALYYTNHSSHYLERLFSNVFHW